MILITPKQELEWKSEWFRGVKFYRSKLKVEWENGVWTKIRFLASGFLFTCGNFTLIFIVFSICWIGFFLNGFPNQFTAHSRTDFLFGPNFHFSLVVFCSHAAFWHQFFFSNFFIWFFFGNGFPNSITVRYKSFIVYSMLYVRFLNFEY